MKECVDVKANASGVIHLLKVCPAVMCRFMISSRATSVEKGVICIIFKLGQPGPSNWTRLSHDEILDTPN